MCSDHILCLSCLPVNASEIWNHPVWSLSFSNPDLHRSLYFGHRATSPDVISWLKRANRGCHYTRDKVYWVGEGTWGRPLEPNPNSVVLCPSPSTSLRLWWLCPPLSDKSFPPLAQCLFKVQSALLVVFELRLGGLAHPANVHLLIAQRTTYHLLNFGTRPAYPLSRKMINNKSMTWRLSWMTINGRRCMLGLIFLTRPPSRHRWPQNLKSMNGWANFIQKSCNHYSSAI